MAFGQPRFVNSATPSKSIQQNTLFGGSSTASSALEAATVMPSNTQPGSSCAQYALDVFPVRGRPVETQPGSSCSQAAGDTPAGSSSTPSGINESLACNTPSNPVVSIQTVSRTPSQAAVNLATSMQTNSGRVQIASVLAPRSANPSLNAILDVSLPQVNVVNPEKHALLQ